MPNSPGRGPGASRSPPAVDEGMRQAYPSLVAANLALHECAKKAAVIAFKKVKISIAGNSHKAAILLML